MSALSINCKYAVRITYSLHRFHTCVPSYGQAQVMRKLLKGSSKRKHLYNEVPTLLTPEIFSKGAFEGKRSPNSKRAAVLNKLFMRYITDLMSTGENVGIYAGLGIEINKVQVSPDYKQIQVYWIAKGNEKDDVIHKLLTKNAGQLRHELTQLRVIGVVPKLLFCKDKTLARLIEIDRKLDVADFGDDHTPLDIVSKLKTELEFNTRLEPEIREKISELSMDDTDEAQESPIPIMPQNVFGLNHADIMSRVIRNVRKAQANHRKEAAPESVLFSHSINANPLQFEEGISQKEALKKFILQRQLERSRAKKQCKNYTPDAEYMQKELEESYKNNITESCEDIYEKDYIEEYDEENDHYEK